MVIRRLRRLYIYTVYILYILIQFLFPLPLPGLRPYLYIYPDEFPLTFVCLRGDIMRVVRPHSVVVVSGEQEPGGNYHLFGMSTITIATANIARLQVDTVFLLGKDTRREDDPTDNR